MTEPAKITSIKQPFLQMRIFGKVEEIRRHEDSTITRILCPAADAYSQPSWVEVRSKSRFGTKGEEIECLVKLRGFKGRPFDVKDKETGEVRKGQSVIHMLELVEEA